MSELLTLSARCLRLSRRQIDALMTAVLMPVLLMVIFVELFGGAIHTGSRYVTYVVPGVLLLCTGFGSALTAVSVCQDASGGIIDRLRAMNVHGAALLGGHVIASILRNAVSTVIVIVVAVALGFRPHADLIQWLAAAGVLLTFAAAVSWLAAGSRAHPRPRTDRRSSSRCCLTPAARSCLSRRCRTGSRASLSTSRSPR